MKGRFTTERSTAECVSAACDVEGYSPFYIRVSEHAPKSEEYCVAPNLFPDLASTGAIS